MTWKSLSGKSVISSNVLASFIFISLTGNCKAQESSHGVIIVPIIIVVVGLAFLCFCFCTLVAIAYYVRKKNKNNPEVSSINPQGQIRYSQSQVNGAGNQQYRPHSCSLPSSRIISLPPRTNRRIMSQTVPQSSEPVSVPEAILHQWEAPPTYEEAIRVMS